MRRQVVLDAQSEELLNQLAEARAGNRSFVVREAIALYAALEDQLDEIESDPAFRRRMRRTAADIEAGRVLTRGQAEKRLRRKR
jgi:predicted transcriptional regulator